MDNDQGNGEQVDRSHSSRTVGQILREARAERRLSLEQVAAELRIEPRWLEAMEHDRLTEIDPPVFARGYLKQYGQLLGLDPAQLIERYHAQVGPQETSVAPSRSIQLRDERQITLWIVAVVALAVLAGLLFVWWISGADLEVPGVVGERPAAELPLTTDPALSSDETDPALSSDDEAGAVPDAFEPGDPAFAAPTGAPGDAGSPASSAGVEESPGGFAPAPAVEPPTAGGPAGEAAPDATEPAGDAAPDAGEAAEPAAGDAAPDGLQVELIFDADSWAEASTADGDRLFYGLGRAGERSRFVAEEPLTVLLGNARGVRVRVDGRSWSIPEAARQGNLARFTLRVPND